MTAEDYDDKIAEWCDRYVRGFIAKPECRDILGLSGPCEQWPNVILEDILDAEYIG